MKSDASENIVTLKTSRLWLSGSDAGLAPSESPGTEQ